MITDVRTVAKNLPLAVLSALAHARSRDGDVILEVIGAVLQEMRQTDPDTAEYFFDFLELTLGKTPAGKKWKDIMSFVSYFPGRGTVRETAYLEGEAKGKAKGGGKGILLVLEVRGISVPDDVRERITTCTDLDRIDTWLERSRTVACAEDLFAGDPESVPSDPEQG
ncbi:hypothetical protein [Streptomyces sp. NRRL WC-3618]|uniref:hypothetical protein n=1 Tax=Streptomyces sp. NRRL WC-3618 TaxID=1519490 RepID=UPI001F3B26DA|nr:hypothetical protein [Streptomyces sp. NRRL WC-3618]